MDFEQLQRAIEAILFASGERIDIRRFADVFEMDPDENEKAAAYDRAEDELGDFLFATVNAARDIIIVNNLAN